jgi:hypothetical protein
MSAMTSATEFDRFARNATKPHQRSDGIRDARGRFICGHVPLPGAGRPHGSVSAKFRPLFDMMKQAVESEALIAEAEAEFSVATLLQRRRLQAERQRRHRARRRDGTFCAQIRFTPTLIADLVELGLLPQGQRSRLDYETAVYTMVDLARMSRQNKSKL